MAEIGNHAGNEPWPSLEIASWLFDRASFVLIGSLIFGALATVTIVWMGIVKEHHWDLAREQSQERIAVLNKETARLSADAEASRAAIADANARALEAQAQLAQFKAPRTMTEAQAHHFIEEASKYSGTQADIWTIGDIPEPTGIGQIILKLLEASGWETASWRWTGGGAVTGIAVAVKDASGLDIDHAANFLVDSLNAAGIASARLPFGADWDKFPGILTGPLFSADKAAPIRVVIGTKPQQ